MRAGGTSGGAAQAYDLSARDLLSHAYAAPAEMAVNGHISAAVVDYDIVAVAAGVERADDHLACVGRHDVRARRSGYVYALMIAL